MHPDYEDKIRDLKFIVSQRSDENDGEALRRKLRLTDKFRGQNFAKSHLKMAEAIHYE